LPLGKGENPATQTSEEQNPRMPEHSWVIDELQYAGPEHLDPGFVIAFDEKQGRPDPGEDLDWLAGYGIDNTSTVLDLGAGTGQFALEAGRRFGRVIAVDVSPAMVAVLRRRIEAEGLMKVQVEQAGFLSYLHEGPPVDAVYTRNALHQLPDFWKALALCRIARMLRHRGVLLVHDLIYDFRPDDAETVLAEWFDQAATDAALGYTRNDFIEHVRTEHSTFRWLFEPMLEMAGFDIAEVEYDRCVYGTYLAVRR